MSQETEFISPVEKRWGKAANQIHAGCRDQILKAVMSAFETNYGFIIIKKDRSGGYRVRQEQWPEVLEALKIMGAIPGYREGGGNG